MNTNIQNSSTLFCDRNIDATFQPTPTRFSTEVEGEGMEVFLRGFLVACLVAALTICTFSIPTGSAAQTPTLPDASTAVAACVPTVPSVTAPAVKL